MCGWGCCYFVYDQSVCSQLSEHDEQCKGGLARAALHTGDVRRLILAHSYTLLNHLSSSALELNA